MNISYQFCVRSHITNVMCNDTVTSVTCHDSDKTQGKHFNGEKESFMGDMMPQGWSWGRPNLANCSWDINCTDKHSRVIQTPVRGWPKWHFYGKHRLWRCRGEWNWTILSVSSSHLQGSIIFLFHSCNSLSIMALHAGLNISSIKVDKYILAIRGCYKWFSLCCNSFLLWYQWDNN